MLRIHDKSILEFGTTLRTLSELECLLTAVCLMVDGNLLSLKVTDTSNDVEVYCLALSGPDAYGLSAIIARHYRPYIVRSENHSVPYRSFLPIRFETINASARQRLAACQDFERICGLLDVNPSDFEFCRNQELS